MKKIFISPVTWLMFLLAFVFSGAAYSQDDIIMQNDNVVKAKVEEVGVNTIKYRKADNMDGPIYDMPKSDVYMIVYNNGSRDVINPRGTGGGDAAQAPSTEDDVPAPVAAAPPAMPAYEQPMCPTEGYLWTPGYWYYGPAGYYWVPGVWVSPPHPGFLWTPGYWGFVNGYYGWHGGYWGEHIGFYGGVNYGYGYGGSGYYGGRWEGGAFRYNTAVCHVDLNVVHATYEDRTVIRVNENHASFNGEGGVRAEATANERMAMNEKHVQATPEQRSHVMAARSDKSQYESENHGKPAVTAMNKPNGQHFSQEGHPTVAHPNTQTNVHAAATGHNATPAAAHSTTSETHNAASTTTHSATSETHTTQPASQQHTATTTSQQSHNTTSKTKPGTKPAPKPAAKPAPARTEEKR